MNNLQLLGAHFVQIGNLLNQWNPNERMTGIAPATYRPGGQGTSAAARRPSRSRSRARVAGGATTATVARTR